MKKSISITVFSLHTLLSGTVRDIFEYDTDWKHTDYDIIAHGSIHGTGKAFKILHCGSGSKIVIEK